MLDFAVQDTWRIFRIMGQFVEGFETVTRIQTKKVKPFPVILVGDDDYWDGLVSWIEGTLVPRGKVRSEEVSILKRARTSREVLRILKSQARSAPRDVTGLDRAGKEIP